MATLKEAINIAKTEPNSARSKELKTAILAGKLDRHAASEGIDLSAFKTQFGVEPTGILSTVLQPTLAEVRKGDPGRFEAAIAPPLPQEGLIGAGLERPGIERGVVRVGAPEPEPIAKERIRLEEEARLKEAAGASVEAIKKAPVIRDVVAGIDEAREKRAARQAALEQMPDETNIDKINRSQQERLNEKIDIIEFVGLPIVKPVEEAFFKLTDLALSIPLPAGVPVQKDTEGATNIPFTDIAIDFFASPRDIASTLSEATPEKIKAPIKETALSSLRSIGEWFDGLDPTTQQNIKGLGTIGRIVSAFVAAGQTAKAARALPKTAKAVGVETQVIVKETLPAITARPIEKGKKVVAARTAKKAAKETAAVEDFVSPKINAKETQKIVAEGRAVKGKKGILGGKKPDLVEQTAEVKRAAGTATRRIEGFADLAKKGDDFVAVKAVDAEITNIAKLLSPEMKKVPVSKSTVSKMDESWRLLKKQQADTPEFGNFPGAKKVQEKFERLLAEAKNAETLDDLWDLRKKYDGPKFTPPSVKKATGASAPFTQLQKEMWLENRGILNDMINSEALGLGNVSKQAFVDMSDLYTVKQNLATKAKIDVKGKPGAIGQFIKRAGLPTGGIGGSILALLGVKEILD